MVLLGEVLVAIGVGSRMFLHQHSVAGGEVEVLDGEERGIVIVTMITGGYHRLEGTVILRLLPGAVDVEAVVGIVETVEVVGEGRETRDLVVRPAETPDTIERAADPDRRTRRGALCAIFMR